MMPEEDMILDEQIEQEFVPEEVENYEEQTEQDASNSLDDILAGVNELLEQSSSYNAYLEENQSEPENPIVAFDNGNAVAVSDLDAIAVQAANSSVYPGTWSGSILDYFSGVMRQNPGKHYVAFRNSQYSYFLYYGDDLTFSDGVVSGSADYVEYNYNNNNYVVTRGTIMSILTLAPALFIQTLILRMARLMELLKLHCRRCCLYLSSFALASLSVSDSLPALKLIVRHSGLLHGICQIIKPLIFLLIRALLFFAVGR